MRSSRRSAADRRESRILEPNLNFQILRHTVMMMHGMPFGAMLKSRFGMTTTGPCEATDVHTGTRLPHQRTVIGALLHTNDLESTSN